MSNRTARMEPSRAARRLAAIGDSGLLVEFGERDGARIDATINARAVALAGAVRNWHRRGIRDVVVTYRTVAIWFDPLTVDLTELRREIESIPDQTPIADPVGENLVEIPVRYGGADGPDLPDVARFAGLSEREVVELHAGTVYRVYMLGFMPGFGYMASVDPRIAMPRHPTPRVRVPEGSVGIAGSQTGVYPAELPGGWQLIGRTATRLFEADRDEPFLLKPGAHVRFIGSLAES